MSYNGWANKDTWELTINFSPEDWIDGADLKDYLMNETDSCPRSIQWMVQNSLNRVDWDEIDAWIKEVKED